jgi:hypothetical protein
MLRKGIGQLGTRRPAREPQHCFVPVDRANAVAVRHPVLLTIRCQPRVVEATGRSSESESCESKGANRPCVERPVEIRRAHRDGRLGQFAGPVEVRVRADFVPIGGPGSKEPRGEKIDVAPVFDDAPHSCPAP